MTLTNVLLYAAIIVFVIYRRMQGRPVGTVKQLLLLPVVLTVVGVEDLAHAHQVNGIDVAVTVAGAVLSLLLGGLRGSHNKLTVHDGAPWVRWGAVSLVIFAVNIVAKLALDGIGLALGGTSSGIGASLLLAAGLMLLGEAGVVWLRIQAGAGVDAGRPGQYRWPG